MFWATASADEIVNRRKRKCYASTYDASTVINFILAPFFVQILCTCSVKVPMATYENPTCTRRGQSSLYQGNATKVNIWNVRVITRPLARGWREASFDSFRIVKNVAFSGSSGGRVLRRGGLVSRMSRWIAGRWRVGGRWGLMCRQLRRNPGRESLNDQQ